MSEIKTAINNSTDLLKLIEDKGLLYGSRKYGVSDNNSDYDYALPMELLQAALRILGMKPGEAASGLYDGQKRIKVSILRTSIDMVFIPDEHMVVFREVVDTVTKTPKVILRSRGLRNSIFEHLYTTRLKSVVGVTPKRAGYGYF